MDWLIPKDGQMGVIPRALTGSRRAIADQRDVPVSRGMSRQVARMSAPPKTRRSAAVTLPGKSPTPVAVVFRATVAADGPLPEVAAEVQDQVGDTVL